MVVGRRVSAGRYPPGPDDNIVQALYSTYRQQRDRLGFLLDMAQRYGDIVHFRTGPRHIYLLNHPDLIHSALVEQASKVIHTRPHKRAFGRFLGQSLLVLDGELHRRERRLAQPAFRRQRIDAYASIMVEHARRAVNSWQPGQTLAIEQEMMRITLGIVAETLFSAEVSAEAATVGQAMVVLQEAVVHEFATLIHLPDWIPTPRKRREQQAIQALDGILYRIIEQRRESGEDKGDLLSMLLLARDEDGDHLSLQQLRDETISLFLAGHETTSNLLSWLWLLLAQHPPLLQRLVQEVDSVLDGRPPTLADIAQLPFTNSVIKEGLRLYPPVWLITREATEALALGGYSLEPGAVLVMCPYVTQRHPRYFPQPEVFRPQRFAEFEATWPPFAYFPFGGGPHVCLGQSFAMMEATLILASIAQRYRLDLVPGQSIAVEPLISLRPGGHIWMTVTERAPAQPR